MHLFIIIAQTLEFLIFFSNHYLKKNVSLESKHEYNDISFIMFNYSSNISKIQEYSKKSEFILKPQHYVVGKIDKNFKSFNLYLANKQYYIIIYYSKTKYLMSYYQKIF